MGDQRRLLTLHDDDSMQMPAQPVLSPDGRYTAVCVCSCLERDNVRLQSLYLVEIDGGSVRL